MKHPERVEDYLGHIAEAIERATSYLQPLPDRAAFEQNPQVQDAVVRDIEIIGEAANHINRIAPNAIDVDDHSGCCQRPAGPQTLVVRSARSYRPHRLLIGLPFVQQMIDLPFQLRQVLLYGAPDNFEIDGKVGVNDSIAHVPHIRPGKLGMLRDYLALLAHFCPPPRLLVS